MNSKKGAFGAGADRFEDKLTSLKSFGTKYLSGNISGDLIVWIGTSIAKKSKKAMFTKPIDAIFTTTDFAFVGDRNGNVIILNDQLQRLHGFNITAEKEILQSMDIGINSFFYEEGRLIIGTRGNEVYEYSFSIENG